MLPSEVTSRLVAQVSLADYTNNALIVPSLSATDAPGVIAELSHCLQRHGCVSDVLPLYHAALNKELMDSSAQSCGIAFPHARLSGIKRLQFAVGCAPNPILWSSAFSARVQTVFLLAVPASDAAGYLHLLASIARLGQRPDLLERMQKAHTAADILSVLTMVTIRH